MITGRFAPTPSGDLHRGHARTAWTAWRHARDRGGRFLLRIDDLDPDRCRPEFIERQIEDLRWLGIDWDDEPILQSTRIDHYRAAADRLIAEGLAYPCFCSRAEVRAATMAPHGPHGPVYPGTCRTLPDEERDERVAAGERHALRLAVPHGEIQLDDLFHGRVTFDPASGGDLVLVRSDGAIGYQLACAVDDGDPGITHVIRGDDLLPSAAFQVVLMRLLELEQPVYGHLPLVLGDDGERLSKRHGSETLRALREAGVRPGDVVGGSDMPTAR